MNEPRDKDGMPWKLWRTFMHLEDLIENPPAIKAEAFKELAREGDDVPF